MSKLITTVSHILPKEEQFAIDWSVRNADKFAIFLKAYGTGKTTKTIACNVAGFNIRSIQRVAKAAETILNYCEENNINYEDTDAANLINAYFNIEKVKKQACDKLVDYIYKQAEDNFQAAKYLLGKIDPEWQENNNSQVNVNVDTNKGVTIELVDYDKILEHGASAQEQLINITRETK